MSPAPGAPVWTRPYLAAVAVTCLVFIAVGMTIPLLPFVVTDGYGGTQLAVGLVFGASAVSAIAARPWLGPLGDRRGRRLLLVGGTVVAAAGLVGHLLAGSVAEMVVARLVLGAGQAGVVVAATTLALDLAPEGRRGEASSYLFIAVNGGLGTGPVLGELLDRIDTDAAWLGASATCLVAGLLGLTLPRVPRRLRGAVATGPVRASYGTALRTGALAGLGTLGFAGFLAMVPLYADELGVTRTPLIFILASGTVVAVRVVAAKVPDRLGPRTVARASFLTLAAGFALMAAWQSTPGLLVGTVVMAAGLSLLVPSLVLHATEGVAEGEETRRMSAFTVFLDLGAAVGPSALGLVASTTSYESAFLFCAGAALVGLVLLLRWVPQRALQAGPAC